MVPFSLTDRLCSRPGGCHGMNPNELKHPWHSLTISSSWCWLGLCLCQSSGKTYSMYGRKLVRRDRTCLNVQTQRQQQFWTSIIFWFSMMSLSPLSPKINQIIRSCSDGFIETFPDLKGPEGLATESMLLEPQEHKGSRSSECLLWSIYVHISCTSHTMWAVTINPCLLAVYRRLYYPVIEGL